MVDAPRPGRVSLADVARLSGVSPITVSRVANGSQAVRPATRTAVLDAMDKLGYAPNRAARALRSGTFQQIGIVVHRLDRTGESRTIEGIVTAAREHGYTVSLVDVAHPDDVEVSAAARRLVEAAVDGLVILRSEMLTGSSPALPTGVPVVVQDSRLPGAQPSVGSDQTTGTRAGVRHLLDLGHATVHHLAGPADSTPANLREQAWRASLAEAGRPVPAVTRGDWTMGAGYRYGRELPPEVTAVLAANDEMAAGLVRALHERGLRVPADVSVVGVDDIPLAEYLWPPLTTVRQDFHRIGAEMVRVLLAQVGTRGPTPAEHVSVPTQLVVRASTAAPGPGR